MSATDLRRFQEIVLEDPELHRSLHAVTDREAFVDAVVARGAEYDCAISRDEVEEALKAAGRDWIERWIL